jgi:cell wall-associated NlpC family hydrolase
MTTPGPTVRTPVGAAPVIPVFLVGTGMFLSWYGVHYWRSDSKYPTDVIKSVLQGKGLPSNAGTPTADEQAVVTAAQQQAAAAQLAAQQGVTPGTGQANPNVVGQAVASGAGLGPAIAADAQRYVGAGYVYGGNASKVGDWDCSSFVSYVLGHDLGLGLPGGGQWGQPGYPPSVHGPTTLNYMLFGQGIPLSEVRAGDLVVSTVHMGIATGPTTMVSAQDPQQGTGPGEFPTGFPGGPPVYRRIT